MGAYIFRQPNGLLGRFSTIVDCPTHHNMTDEDYIELCAERARKEAREMLDRADLYVEPYQRCINDFVPGNMTREEFDNIRKEMESPSPRQET